MKYRIWMLSLLWFFSGQLMAQDAQKLFKEGNQLYQQNKYEQAVALYDSILALGMESGELYFNLGNTHYRLGHMGLARLNYEKAAKFLKNDPAISENLELLKMQLVDKIQTPPKFFLYKWMDVILNLFSMQSLSWIVLALLWLVLGVAAVRQFYLKRKRVERLRTAFVSTLIVFILATLLLGQKIYLAETEVYAVVLKPSVTLYAEPSSTGTEVFILHEGTKMKIRREKQDWLEIVLADGKTGWIERSALAVI